MRKEKNFPNKTIIGTAIALLVAGAVVGGVFVFKRKQSDNQKPTNTTSTGEYINLEPPTEEDLKETDQNKDDLANNYPDDSKPTGQPTQAPSDGSGNKASAAVFITHASQQGADIEVSSYIQNIFEDDGTCTLTLTKGSATVTKTTTGVRNVNRTSCPTLTINRSELSEAGTWQAVVSYESATAKGASAPQEVAVQ